MEDKRGEFRVSEVRTMTDQTRPLTFEAETDAWSVLRHHLPGLAATLALALVATVVQRLSGIAALSPLVLAMVLGIAIRNTVGLGVRLMPGVAFSGKRVLRWAIVLLGFQLTLAQVASIGGRGLFVVVGSLVATFVFTRLMARVIGVERGLGELIAAGTSICGASAVVACNTVTRAGEEDVAYAISCVTLFGSLSMVLFPVFAGATGMGHEAYGLWVGAAVHEVAQVVAGAFALGEAAGQAGTVAKLTRVLLLAPVILSLAMMARGRLQAGETQARVPVPWFAFAFVGVVALNSVIAVPGEVSAGIARGATFLLTVSLGALGLSTDLRKLHARGLRPLALGALAWVFISGLALGLVVLVG